MSTCMNAEQGRSEHSDYAAMDQQSIPIVELTEQDIPGASLKEPFDSHNVTALRWWLQCRGIKAPSSWRKNQLVAK